MSQEVKMETTHTLILGWFSENSQAEKAVHKLKASGVSEVQIGRIHPHGIGIAYWHRNMVIGGALGALLGFFIGELGVFVGRDFAGWGMVTGTDLTVPILTGLVVAGLGGAAGVFASKPVSRQQVLDEEEAGQGGKILVSVSAKEAEKVEKMLRTQGALEVTRE